jgi:hypothetical protein
MKVNDVYDELLLQLARLRAECEADRLRQQQEMARLRERVRELEARTHSTQDGLLKNAD